ncbi:hypothetical protein BLOT_003422 [Blomia tropicalis]|nr:hypothetical protein BLOT_003422 [Blomia tropicalis]
MDQNNSETSTNNDPLSTRTNISDSKLRTTTKGRDTIVKTPKQSQYHHFSPKKSTTHQERKTTPPAYYQERVFNKKTPPIMKQQKQKCKTSNHVHNPIGEIYGSKIFQIPSVPFKIVEDYDTQKTTSEQDDKTELEKCKTSVPIKVVEQKIYDI